MRLQVYLSHSGACSRRAALDIILAGRVSVNQKKIAEPSFGIDPFVDKICLDGKPLSLPQKITILLHKPQGVVTTKSDPFASRTVLDLLPEKFKHVFPVGRLDRDTTGLLLLTNDGPLAHHLIHPSFEVDKVYRAVLDRPLAQEDRRHLEKGILMEDKKTSPCRIKFLGASCVEITIHEGRKRQIRKMFALLRYHVQELCRIQQGSLTLGNLKPGEWRFLTEEEVCRLYRELKLK